MFVLSLIKKRTIMRNSITFLLCFVGATIIAQEESKNKVSISGTVDAYYKTNFTSSDKAIFTRVFQQAALGVSNDTKQAELDLQRWFETQGVTVLPVDRSLFRAKVLPLHHQAKKTLGVEFYERLQNIQ